ncbi:MAG: ribosome biogenesis GTPase Der [Acidobacteriota bacterium]
MNEAVGPAGGVIPVVAIVGRPNVGKSTLFNRLVGRRQAIVHDQPGVTRDSIFGRFQMDDERTVDLIDTGGLVPGDDPLGLSDQVHLAVDEADLVLLVVDGKEGVTTADERVLQDLRPSGKPIVIVVNKGDTRAAEDAFPEFYALGIGDVVLISAEHGRGMDLLHEEIERYLPPAPADGLEDEELPAIAVVGRPNVGKSSLVNRLLGEARTLVSPVAGTTRDPVDSLLEWEGQQIRLIDTAGIRRRSQVTGFAEDIAVMFARRQIERASVVVLMVDADQGITTGDLSIAGMAWELGRAVVVAVNKWDLLDDEKRESLDEDWPRLDQLLSNPERVNLSALTGRHIDKLLPAALRVLERSAIRLTTSDVNRIFEEAIRRHQPPHDKGRPWKLYYATQVGGVPPTFMLFANRKLARSDTYRRYLENRLREQLDVGGVPVRLVIRQRT